MDANKKPKPRPLPICRFCGKNDGDGVLVIGDTCTDCARTWR